MFTSLSCLISRTFLSTLLCAAALTFSFPAFAQFITLDDPFAAGVGFRGTYANGVSGDNVVGSYYDNSGTIHGFLYNIKTSKYTTVDNNAALATPGYGTVLTGIYGSNTVGTYADSNGNRHGFLHDITTVNFSSIDHPSASNNPVETRIRNHDGTYTAGISGNIAVGDYVDSSGVCHGYEYDIQTSTFIKIIDNPNASAIWGGNTAYGISGTGLVGVYNVVGAYLDDTNNIHGYLYDGATDKYLTIDDPLGIHGTSALGVSGSNVVGYYYDSNGFLHGFLFDGKTYTTIDDPAGIVSSPEQQANGVFENKIVGFYLDSTGNAHGYLDVTPTPEPGSLSLLAGFGIASLGFLVSRRLRRT
jgi:hypothetical protein